MSRTNDLRKLIKEKLGTINGVKAVYYKTAGDQKVFPHIVFTLTEISLGSNDLHRKDYVLEVDVWDYSPSEANVFALCDSIEDLFNAVNLPQTNILATFFLDSRKSILDEDKKVKHELIKFTVQLYER